MTVFHSLEHWHFSYCYLYSIYIVYIFSYCLQLFFCWNKNKSNNFGWNILISTNCCSFKFSIWFKYTSIIFPKIRFKLNIMFLEIASRISSSSLLNCKMRSKNRLPLVLPSLVKNCLLLFHCFSRKYRARASIQI